MEFNLEDLKERAGDRWKDLKSYVADLESRAVAGEKSAAKFESERDSAIADKAKAEERLAAAEGGETEELANARRERDEAISARELAESGLEGYKLETDLFLEASREGREGPRVKSRAYLAHVDTSGISRDPKTGKLVGIDAALDAAAVSFPDLFHVQAAPELGPDGKPIVAKTLPVRKVEIPGGTPAPELGDDETEDLDAIIESGLQGAGALPTPKV